MTHDELIPLQIWHPESTKLLAAGCLPLTIDEADAARLAGARLSHAATQACLMSAYLRIEAYLASAPAIARIVVSILPPEAPDHPESLAASLFDPTGAPIPTAGHPLLIDALDATASRIGEVEFGPQNLDVLGRDILGAAAYQEWMALRESHGLASACSAKPRRLGAKASL